MASKPTRLHLDVTHQHLMRCVAMKRGYVTRAQALDVAEAQMDEGRVKPGCHITPYLCEHCGEWHLCNRVIVPVP